MKNDKYQKLRDAVKALPDYGQWKANFNMLAQVQTECGAIICKVQKTSSLTDLQNKQHYIAAANPDTIRALLAELDAKTAALEDLAEAGEDVWGRDHPRVKIAFQLLEGK